LEICHHTSVQCSKLRGAIFASSQVRAPIILLLLTVGNSKSRGWGVH